MFGTKQRVQTIIHMYLHYFLTSNAICYFLQLNCPFYVTQCTEEWPRCTGGKSAYTENEAFKLFSKLIINQQWPQIEQNKRCDETTAKQKQQRK